MSIKRNGINYTDGKTDIDIRNKIITFDSQDELDPESSVEMPLMESGHTMKNFMKSISMGVKNIRWLLKMLGTTDISTIPTGTLTGGLKYVYDKNLWEDISSSCNSGYYSGVTYLKAYCNSMLKMIVFYCNINASVGNQTVIFALPHLSYAQNIANLRIQGIGASETSGVAIGIRDDNTHSQVISSHTQGLSVVNPVYLGFEIYT